MRVGDVYAWFPDGVVAQLSSGDGFHFQACVHPDGGHAVYWGGVSGAPRVWRVGLDGGRPEPPEAIGPVGARHPAYGARGDTIVCAVDLEGGETVEETFATAAGTPGSGTRLALWAMAPDGSGGRQLTDGSSQDQRPCLSPDGATVTFVSDRRPAGLWTVPIAGGEPAPLLPDGVPGYRPWPSVDGRWLFFFRLHPRRRQVHRVAVGDPDAVPEPLPNDDRPHTHGPFADPRGDRLLVHSNRSGQWGLYELPLDGSPMRPLVPPGFEDAANGHATRSHDGVVCFDSGRTTMGN